LGRLRCARSHKKRRHAPPPPSPQPPPPTPTTSHTNKTNSGGVDRLAFSVIWTLDADAKILSTRFCKSVIRSRAALTYQQAQERIDAAEAATNSPPPPPPPGRDADPVTASLRLLMLLSKKIRARRFAAGALELASPEVRFDIDREALASAPKGAAPKIRSVGCYQSRDTNAMVEEWMLLANQSVARAIVERFPAGALLRRHQAPAPRQFEPLLAAGAAAGFAIDPSSSGALGRSLDAARRDGDPYFNTLVRLTATRCMTQARYFGSGEVGSAAEHWHYGLAAPIYTHFTSPIRRYADVVVHRLLGALIGANALPDSLRDRDALRSCSDNLNLRHRNAQMAGRASAELFTLVYFASKGVGGVAGQGGGASAGAAGAAAAVTAADVGEVAEARVVKVRRDGCVVFVPKYGIEGPVEVEEEEGGGGAVGGGGGNNKAGAGGRWRFDEGAQRVEDASGGGGGNAQAASAASAGLFERVRVRISAREGAGRRRRLVLKLVGVGGG
jgi:exosome complex exonuclease DIS3/RRP44